MSSLDLLVLVGDLVLCTADEVVLGLIFTNPELVAFLGLT
jgi:hypothetical protein